MKSRLKIPYKWAIFICLLIIAQRIEIIAAHNACLTKVLEKKGVYYRFGESYTEFIAYEFLIRNGTISNNMKNKYRRVRCIK